MIVVLKRIMNTIITKTKVIAATIMMLSIVASHHDADDHGFPSSSPDSHLTNEWKWEWSMGTTAAMLHIVNYRDYYQYESTTSNTCIASIYTYGDTLYTSSHTPTHPLLPSAATRNHADTYRHSNVNQWYLIDRLEFNDSMLVL